MRKNHYTACELKRLGVHYKTIKALQSIQRKEIYGNRRYEELKIKIGNMVSSLALRVDATKRAVNIE